MPIERDTFEELCASYAVGALEPEEVKILEQALAEADPDALAFFQSMQEVALMLPLSLELETPPTHIKQRLLEEVRRRKSGASSMSSRPSLTATAVAWWQHLTLVWSMTAALFLGGIGLSYFTWNLNKTNAKQAIRLDQFKRSTLALQAKVTKLSTQAQEQKNQLKQQKKRIFAMRNELKRKQRLVKLLARRNVALVQMEVRRSRKLKRFAGGYAKVIWDPKSNQAILQLAGLPTYKNKDYQLWMIGRGGLQKAGVYAYKGNKFNFYPAAVPRPKSKRRRQRIQFALSLEPKGGSPKPTPSGPVFMASPKIRISL